MHITYTRRLIIALLIAYVAATDLQINGAEKAGEDAVILRSNNSSVIESMELKKQGEDAAILSSNTNSSVNDKLDPITTNRKKDVHLDNDSSSNEKKSMESVDRRKTNNNSSGSVGELTNIGNQNKLNEAEVEKKRNDNSSERDDRKKEIKEGEQKEKANNSSTKEQGEKGKVMADEIHSTEEMLSTRKENFHGEECDSSYSCTIEEKALVACLRVPGNESPDLSLLVQNKGKDTARISIMAPKFVKLEQNQIELQGKENNKMKVSLRNGGNGNFIILKAGDSQCSLDFTGLIDNADKTSQFNYFFPSFGIMCMVAIALVATVLMYIKRRLLVSNGSHKYQKLDTGLPVSSGGKVETLSTDGWDNNWDDNWDDEEAPKAPVTPSLSSKSISSRRSSKEGWKD